MTLSSALIIFSLPFHIHVFPHYFVLLFLNCRQFSNSPVYLSLRWFIVLCALSLSRKRQYYATFYEYRCVIHRLSIARNSNYLFHARTSKLSVHPAINARYFLFRQNQYRNYRFFPKECLGKLKQND